MTTPAITNVTDSSFQQEVIENIIPVLVDYWAEWCGPCKMLSPILESVNQEMNEKIKIIKMDIENNPDIPSKMGIRSVPTLMIFKGGKEIATRSGVLSKNSIIEWINHNIGT